MDPVEKIAAAVMYEGYVLWPYRRSAPKNSQRWTFGAVFPRAFSESSGTNDAWRMQTECLVCGTAPEVGVRMRFLQVVERRVGRRTAEGSLEFVDELFANGECYLAWDEATDREVVLPKLTLAQMRSPVRTPIQIPAGVAEEPIPNGAGALVRSWHELTGRIEAESERLEDGLFRLTVRILNTGPWEGQDRPQTLRYALVSTHTLLTVTSGEFISLTDPPDEYREAAAKCRNEGTWPVLAGQPDERHTLLSAPIILSDYPQIAPESPGDMFDGGEIDQLLLLNVLTLTDEEKREMRASDPRTREILERAETLTPEDFMRLHGTIRDFRILRPAEVDPFPTLFTPPGPETFGGLERPAPECVLVDGTEVRKGSRVRLRPQNGRDLMDGVLADRIAIVEAVEQDYEDRVHLAVVVEDDPGRELGEARMLGHRFFFAPDEVEPLERQSVGQS